MEGPLQGTRVLVAHAAGDVRRAVHDALEPLDCAVAQTAGPGDALAIARRVRPQVLLLDARFAALLHDVKSDPELFRVAVVAVVDRTDASGVRAALDQGAHDVLAADAGPAEIMARVSAARRLHEMQALLLSREQALEDLAYHDDLTGLPNRRFAMRQLGALLSRTRRHHQELSLLVVDADRFKALNDRYGHLAGDAVLRGLAARLRERVRAEDLAARLGGEEFVVVAPDTGPAGAAALAEDLREAVAASPLEVGRLAVPVTVSVGWASWAGEDVDGLLGRADRALYAAKAAGRDCVRGDGAGARAR
jgi:two-component system, cell cycle response regulator